MTVIDSSITTKQVNHYTGVLEVDLATLFKSMRADVMSALKEDNPLEALEKVFGDLGEGEIDEVDPSRLEMLKTAENNLSLLIEKAKRTKPGKSGTLELIDGHWQYLDKMQGSQERPDFKVKGDVPLKKGFSIKDRTEVKNVFVMASGNKIDQVNELVQNYKLPNGKLTNPADWEKAKGTALITDGKDTFSAEIHWYQCKNIGKIRFKIKIKEEEE